MIERMDDSLPLDPDPFDFTPVATARNRSDGWTPDRQRRFIAALAEHGGVAAAARSVGMTRQTANRLRKRPGAESFARAWDAAVEEGRLRARDEALTRGLHGYRAPVVRNGKVVGHRHRFDNRLLYAACYGEPPARFTRRK
jgi:hypothetical protein